MTPHRFLIALCACAVLGLAACGEPDTVPEEDESVLPSQVETETGQSAPSAEASLGFMAHCPKVTGVDEEICACVNDKIGEDERSVMTAFVHYTATFENDQSEAQAILTRFYDRAEGDMAEAAERFSKAGTTWATYIADCRRS